jgi:hypothetical protein
MRRSYQKVPIPWLQGDSSVPLEPFSILSLNEIFIFIPGSLAKEKN